MKITFIQPTIASLPIRTTDAMQPLVFGVLARLTPSDVTIRLFDERIADIDFEDPTDLAAISVHTFTAKRAYKIAARYRSRGIPVVLGGVHPTLMPDEAAHYADCIAIGDAEETWPQIVEDARTGSLKRRYVGSNTAELKGIIPRRDIFKGMRYAPVIPVQFGRGCRFACDFCSVHAFYGARIRLRPVQEVAEEIKPFRKKTIFFVDDNLCANFDQAQALMDAIEPLGCRWICQISIDIADRIPLLYKMKKSGCRAVYIGFESLNRNNLAQMKKSGNVTKDYLAVVHAIKKAGIMVCGAFVFGYDDDTLDAFEDTLAFARKAKLCLAHFNLLFPTPGTRIYERLKRENRLINDPWWLFPGQEYGRSLFRPMKMTPEQMEEKCYDVRKRYNTFFSIVSRGLDWSANCRSLFNAGAYITANIISRREMYRKQWKELG